MMDEFFKKRYPVYNNLEIKKISTIFSISPHANEKYVVKPKFNVLHPLTAYTLYLISISPFPYIFPLWLELYGFYSTRNSYAHELSHAYRMRYEKFMEEVRGGKKKSRFSNFIDNLERKALNTSNRFKSFVFRELALLFSIPIVFVGYVFRKDKRWYWEEEIAKYEAEILTGRKINSDKKKRFLKILEDLRTDAYVPLKDCEDKNELNEELKFYLENPPAILPKYEMIDKMYKIFK